MIRRHVVIASIALGGALALVGCTEGADNAPLETLNVEGSAADEVTCTAFGDVATIIANADAGLRDGRMEVQEQKGWYRLATRVLDRVPSRGTDAISDAIAAMKDVAPAIAPGAMADPGIGSAQWESGRETLALACNDAGFEMSVDMYTGG